MKKCPFCAESIQDEAIKCRFCNEFLDGRSSVAQTSTKPTLKWMFKPSSIIFGFLFLGPLVLPVIWLHPQYSHTKKIIITIILSTISFFLFKAFLYSLEQLTQYYQIISH